MELRKKELFFIIEFLILFCYNVLVIYLLGKIYLDYASLN